MRRERRLYCTLNSVLRTQSSRHLPSPNTSPNPCSSVPIRGPAFSSACHQSPSILFVLAAHYNAAYE